MKFFTSTVSCILLLTPLAGCADENLPATASRQTPLQLVLKQSNKQTIGISTQILPDGDVLTVTKTRNGIQTASYFSTTAASKEELIKHINIMLKTSKANASIIKFAESRLPRHPFLKKEQFKIIVTAADGLSYEFTYRSDILANIFILSYQRIEKSKA